MRKGHSSVLPSVCCQSDPSSSKSQAGEKKKKKGRRCSADPGLVTRRLWHGWVKLWSKTWEEISLDFPALRLTGVLEILDLSGFELRSLKQLSDNLERFEGTEEDYLLVKLLP